ncbi:uncharacterized protein EDB93DRAFT_1246498 [Suillus bovinus]|uniref:uncharacterized protein n=1 Tax=Suillus bovinus TaxID=48563 RepID=UPI001B86A451|nr:uncharacterized protein EDB93DRAFT_1246498 [Suillus bovinus]KAG2158004.1 hypothetical protein EDB93DRAFT_1246498 [Suillus bovinus]
MSISDASVSSTRSLRLQGPVNEKDVLSRSERTHKAPVHWMHEEEARFLQYLLTHKAQAGDTMSFKKSTFQGAVDNINKVFSNQCEGTKTASLKSSYNTVINIKKTSGFSWSDELRAGITDAHGDIWEKYVKNSPTAKPFKTKEFSYFNIINQIMHHGPSIARGKFVKCQPQASLMASVVPSKPSSSTLMMSPPLNPPSHIPTMNNTMILMQLVSAADMINIHQASPLAQASMTPPSSGSHSQPPASRQTVSFIFSSTTSDSGLTSVSQTKHKFSALPNDGEWQLQKWSRPPSVSVAAQQEGSVVLMSIADALPHIINNFTIPSESSIHTAVPDHPPSTDLGRVINLITETKGLNMDDVQNTGPMGTEEALCHSLW